MFVLILFETFIPLQDKGSLKLRLQSRVPRKLNFINALDSKAEFQPN